MPNLDALLDEYQSAVKDNNQAIRLAVHSQIIIQINAMGRPDIAGLCLQYLHCTTSDQLDRAQELRQQIRALAPNEPPVSVRHIRALLADDAVKEGTTEHLSSMEVVAALGGSPTLGQVPHSPFPFRDNLISQRQKFGQASATQVLFSSPLQSKSDEFAHLFYNATSDPTAERSLFDWLENNQEADINECVGNIINEPKITPSQLLEKCYRHAPNMLIKAIAHHFNNQLTPHILSGEVPLEKEYKIVERQLNSLTFLDLLAVQQLKDTLLKLVQNDVVKRELKRIFLEHAAFCELMHPDFTQEKLQKYIEQGVNTNTLLLVAAKRNKVDIFKFLLKSGHDFCEDMLLSALLPTAGSEILQCLIEENIPFNCPISFRPGKRLTPIMIARKSGNHQAVEFLLQQEIDINLNYSAPSLIHESETILTWAIRKNDLDLAKKLIARSDVDVTVNDNQAIQKAIGKGLDEVVEKLYQKGARVSQSYLTSLLNKVQQGTHTTTPTEFQSYLSKVKKGWYIENSALINLALRENVPPGYLDAFLKEGVPPEFIAMEALDFLDPKLMSTLAKKGIYPPPSGLHKMLIIAIEAGNQDAVEFYVSQGANVNYNQSEALQTMVTCYPPDLNIFKFLLDKRADPRANGYQLPLMAYEAYMNEMYETNPDYLIMMHALLIKMGRPTDQVNAVFAAHYENKIDDHTLFKCIYQMIRNSLTPDQQLAFDLIYMNRTVDRITKESSSEKSLLRRADAKFEEIQQTLKSEFARYGETSIEALTAIERNIKLRILDNIVNNAHIKIDENSECLVQFIETNKLLLLDGNQETLEQFRALCKDNSDTAQVAWRAYDPFAPHDEWANLLTQDVDMRTRVAYYFIATPPINEDNFLAQLADIRRAHPHPTLDSPSCPDGTKGRIAKMGEGHPTLQLPPDRNEIIQYKMNTIIPRIFSEAIVGMPPKEQLELYEALTTLSSRTAMDIIHQQLPFTAEMMALRKAFLSRLPNMLDIQKILNKALKKRGEPPLSEFEKCIVINLDLHDIGGKGRADTLYRRLSDECKEQPKESAQAIYQNPFVVSIAACSNPTMRKAQLSKLEKTIRSHIEFELLYPVLKEHFKAHATEYLLQIAKILCEEITTSQPAEPEDKLRNVITQFQERTRDVIGLNARDMEAVTDIVRDASTIFSIDDTKLSRITNCIEKLKNNTQDEGVLAKIQSVSEAMTPTRSSPSTKRRRLK